MTASRGIHIQNSMNFMMRLPYIQIQRPEASAEWPNVQALLTLLHFEELEQLDLKHKDTDNCNRTTLSKVARAALIAKTRGVPLNIQPRYPDLYSPVFYNNGELQPDYELLHEYLSSAVPLEPPNCNFFVIFDHLDSYTTLTGPILPDTNNRPILTISLCQGSFSSVGGYVN